MSSAHDMRPIIVRRAKSHARPHGNHSWKIAYADFMTAMMALFLVLWLGKRDEFSFYPGEGAPRTADGQQFDPLPVPLPAGDLPASGMDDRDPPPAGTARIDQHVPPPAAPAPAAATPAAPATPGLPAGSASIPRLVHAPPPEYPRDALRARASGEVVIRIDVGADGRPASLEILRSSRNRSLDRAALQAVRQWRFEPAMREGMPVAASVQQTVSFDAPR